MEISLSLARLNATSSHSPTIGTDMADESFQHPDKTPKIQYLNTDLDLVCDLDPTVLAVEFESRGLGARVTPGDDGLFYVLCDDSNDVEPEPNMIRILSAIDALSVSGREIWNRCSKRDFNVGYDCGDEPWSFNQGISNQTLRRIADCGASFRITLYPYRPAQPAAHSDP